MKNYLIVLLFIFTACSTSSKYTLAPDTFILDKEKPIQSLEELISRFKGKAFFIDRWASWCTPCINEFEHSAELHAFLKANDVEILYLNSDTDLQESDWFDLIKKYKLKGNHLRLDSTLKSDLMAKKVFFPMVPQYILFDKNGTLVTNRASKPSTKEMLYNEIKTALGK